MDANMREPIRAWLDQKASEITPADLGLAEGETVTAETEIENGVFRLVLTDTEGVVQRYKVTLHKEAA